MMTKERGQLTSICCYYVPPLRRLLSTINLKICQSKRKRELDERLFLSAEKQIDDPQATERVT